MSKDELAIEVAGILFKLYNVLDFEGKRVSIIPSIKDERPSRSCSPLSFDSFKNAVHERDSIIKFILTFKLLSADYDGEHGKSSVITVIISDENVIKLKLLYEIEDEEFKSTYESLKEFLKNNSNKEVIEEKIVNEKPVEELCDFGILDTFPIARVNNESNVDTKKILESFKNNIDSINKRVFIKLYNNCLWGLTGVDIYDKRYFKEIVNVDKLPSNFFSLNDDEKSKVLFPNPIDESDYENIRTLFNIDKIRDYSKIYNVYINEYELSIEVNFLVDNNQPYCLPYIEFDYNNNFEIDTFDPGL